MKRITLKVCSLFLTLLSLSIACHSDLHNTVQPKPEYNNSDFAQGADVSWLTEMEKSGIKFYTSSGKEMECMRLMRELGMNAIRLRVWVDPTEGWCGKEDVLTKAFRAQQLGLRLMIDFHYSDSWADPGKQNKPADWSNFSIQELQEAVANHTKEVLNLLKKNKIEVEWVQVGNETTTGMLWPEGKCADNDFANFSSLFTAGYEASKMVYPKAKVILHVDNGADYARFEWLFDGLKELKTKWDVIGLSLYPSWSTDTWQEQTSKCEVTMKKLIERYDTEVMLCEIGMPWKDAKTAELFVQDILKKAKEIPYEKCLGVFYWEPEAHNNWKGYDKGAFDNEGKPTSALNPFKKG